MIRKKKQQKKQTTQQSHSSVAPQEQTFIEHIRELRSRLFWILASLLVASSIGFLFKDILVGFVLAPLHGEKLVYLTIGGGFSFIFTVCLYFGIIVSIPVIVYHLYRFLQPVLGETTRRLVVTLVLSSAALAICGAAFGYFVAIQASINFLMGFAEGAITSSVTADSYMNFIIAYTAGLALVFQLPLLLFMFDHIRPFPPGALLTSQRFVITGAIIVAALITPTPDVINQMIIAVPIIAIYELGAVLVFIRRKIRQRKAAANEIIPKEREPEFTPEPAAPRVAAAPHPIASMTRPHVASSPVIVQTPIQEVVRVKQISPNQPVRRSIDGFTRSAPRGLLVPQRPGGSPSPRPTRLGAPTGQRMSVDGFSLVQTG